jgi:hypothetical protein
MSFALLVERFRRFILAANIGHGVCLPAIDVRVKVGSNLEA